MRDTSSTELQHAVMSVLALPASDNTLLLDAQYRARSSVRIWNGHLASSCTPQEMRDGINGDIFAERLFSDQPDESVLTRPCGERRGCSVRLGQKLAQRLVRVYPQGHPIIRTQSSTSWSDLSLGYHPHVIFKDVVSSKSKTKRFQHAENYVSYINSCTAEHRYVFTRAYFDEHCQTAHSFWMLKWQLESYVNMVETSWLRDVINQYLQDNPDFQYHVAEREERHISEIVNKSIGNIFLGSQTITNFKKTLVAHKHNRFRIEQAINDYGYRDASQLLDKVMAGLTSFAQDVDAVEEYWETMEKKNDLRCQALAQEIPGRLQSFKTCLQQLEPADPRRNITIKDLKSPEEVRKLWVSFGLPAVCLRNFPEAREKAVDIIKETIHPSASPSKKAQQAKS